MPDGTVLRRARIAALAVMAVIAALAWMDLRHTQGLLGAATRGAPEGTPVGDDVPAARAELSRRIAETEARCAELAARALESSGGTADRAEMFTALAALDLPPRFGVHVEDRVGRLLAWSGDALDDTTLATVNRPGDGSQIVETPASRRVAVRRRRTSPLDGVPVVAVCHAPVEIRPLLDNRFFAAWSIAGDIESEYRVAAARVLVAPVAGDPAAADPPSGTAVPSMFGGTLAFADAEPIAPALWTSRVRHDGARRTSILVLAAVVAALAWMWIETAALSARRPAAAWCLRGASIVAARTVLAFHSLESLLPPGPPTDVSLYGHLRRLAFSDTAADLLLSCAAATVLALCMRAAAKPRADGTPRIPAPPLVRWIVLAAAAIAGRALLGWLIEDTVGSSRVEYFPRDAVLPHLASAVLLAAFLAAGMSVVFALQAVMRLLAGSSQTVRDRAATAVVLAVLVAPWGPASLGGEPWLPLFGVAAFSAALLPAFLESGVALRAAVIPLGVALGMFAPVERHLDLAQRLDVQRAATERVTRSEATEREIALAALDVAVASPELRAALRSAAVSREVMRRIWLSTGLPSRAGSAIEVQPLASPALPARFAANLPPAMLLPLAGEPLRGVAPAARPGRGAMRDGRWLLADREIEEDGITLARVRVTIETRTPGFLAIPKSRLVSQATPQEVPETPHLAAATYGADGTLLPHETNDLDRPAGTPLDADIREEAVGGKVPAWRRVRAGGRDLAVVTIVERGKDDAVAGFHAFSYDTGGARRVALRAARAALFGALLSCVLLLATVRRWAAGAQLRLTHRLVASFVLVSGVPLLVLGWANRELARENADEAARGSLRQAALLVASVVESTRDATIFKLSEGSESAADETVHAAAYDIGHPFSVFLDARLAELLRQNVARPGQFLVDAKPRASSIGVLADSALLPRRLPGDVYRELVLLGRPFHAAQVTLDGVVFDVGYAPLRYGGSDAGSEIARDGQTSGEGAREVIGAVSVPLLEQRRERDRELADAVAAILGLYLASLVIAVTVGVWIASRLAAPLRSLSDATQRVAAGDLTQPVPQTGPGELAEVAGGFNRMMRDLAESRERLVRAEKEAAWRDMARQVAHEVKNPLTPMRLAAEHIRRAFRDKHPAFEEILERGVDVIVRQTESLKQIATAFSDFARHSGRRREPVDLGEVVRTTLDLYRSNDAIEIRADIAPGLRPVLADPDELRRVLVNVVKNAVEAVESVATVAMTGDSKLRGKVSAALRAEGGFLVLDVSDDGPGIPPEVLPRLFEPYFSTKTSGTGLGLAICKRAVEDLGGTIAIDGAEGGGTNVRIRLPCATT